MFYVWFLAFRSKRIICDDGIMIVGCATHPSRTTAFHPDPSHRPSAAARGKTAKISRFFLSWFLFLSRLSRAVFWMIQQQEETRKREQKRGAVVGLTWPSMTDVALFHNNIGLVIGCLHFQLNSLSCGQPASLILLAQCEQGLKLSIFLLSDSFP